MKDWNIRLFLTTQQTATLQEVAKGALVYRTSGDKATTATLSPRVGLERRVSLQLLERLTDVGVLEKEEKHFTIQWSITQKGKDWLNKPKGEKQ